jgi:ABC-type dipeptide/oligopeptide/nickel transport system permease subunit
VNIKRRTILVLVALQVIGMFVGFGTPLGEMTVHGIILFVMTLILLFPGSLLAIPLTSVLLPREVIESQRTDSILNILTAVLLNSILFWIITAILKRRERKK